MTQKIDLKTYYQLYSATVGTTRLMVTKLEGSACKRFSRHQLLLPLLFFLLFAVLFLDGLLNAFCQRFIILYISRSDAPKKFWLKIAF